MGFFVSIPFSDLLLRSVSSNMVLEADNHFPVVGSGGNSGRYCHSAVCFSLHEAGEEVFSDRCDPFRSDGGTL